MPIWLALVEGPVFRFVLAILVLGLLRLVVLQVFEIIAALRRAGDRRLPLRQITLQTLSWLAPLTRLHRSRAGYSTASFVFHLGILFAGLFLRNHLEILQSQVNLSWWAISKPVLDALTLAAILAGGFLLFYRLYVTSSRRLSGPADYLLLILILNIFVSGYLAGRPWNPVPYDSVMLFHTLNGMLMLVVVPFSKISHCVLYPLIRLATEIAWHFVPQGGAEIVRTLHGSQGRRI
jgi:nitrate reductase gamma subunit